VCDRKGPLLVHELLAESLHLFKTKGVYGIFYKMEEIDLILMIFLLLWPQMKESELYIL
jgi:hypothetical protein